MKIKEQVKAKWDKYSYTDQKRMKQYVDFICTLLHDAKSKYASEDELKQRLDWKKLKEEVDYGRADSISTMFYTMLYNEVYVNGKYWDNIEFLIDQCDTKWKAWFLADALSDGMRYINDYTYYHKIHLDSLLSLSMEQEKIYGAIDTRLDTKLYKIEKQLSDVFTL